MATKLFLSTVMCLSLVFVILAMFFAMPWYVIHHQSCTDLHEQTVRETAFPDDICATQGSKINKCKEFKPTLLLPENTDLSVEKHPWNSSLSMQLIIHIAITISSMIAVVAILKCSAGSSDDKLDSDRESSSANDVSVAAMEEQSKEMTKSEMVA